jgi:hypothetical protein
VLEHLEDFVRLVSVESLPEIKVLQELDLHGCTGLISAMPLLSAGLRKNTSLISFRFDEEVGFSSFAPAIEDTAPRYEGIRVQEIE